MADLSGYLEELKAERAAWLGQIVFWHIATATRVPVPDLQSAMELAHLKGFAPKEPRLTNVFRSVSSSHARKGVETDTPGVRENYRIEEVKRSEGRVVKDIVVQQVDGNNEELSYDVQVRLEYIQESNTVRYWWIGEGDENPQSMNLAELIATDFRNAQGSYNSNVIRNILRNILEGSNATPIENKAHFVGLDFANRVAGLELLSETIPDIHITAIPLTDSAKQRKMIKQAYEAATVGKINGVLSELDELKGKKISADQFSNLLEQKDKIKTRTREYADLLQIALQESDNWLTIYEKRIMQLLPQVES